MSKVKCKCGELMSNTDAPNDIELHAFTDREWDEIINHDLINPLTIPDPKYNVWRCPHCERLYFFEGNNDKAIKIYKLEE